MYVSPLASEIGLLALPFEQGHVSGPASNGGHNQLGIGHMLVYGTHWQAGKTAPWGRGGSQDRTQSYWPQLTRDQQLLPVCAAAPPLRMHCKPSTINRTARTLFIISFPPAAQTPSGRCTRVISRYTAYSSGNSLVSYLSDLLVILSMLSECE